MAVRLLKQAVSRLGVSLFFLISGAALEGRTQGLNTLTPAQRDSGWVLLFDGKSLFGWHKKQETTTATSWVINDSAISRNSGGNLYSPVTAESFELSIDWKIAEENANSGVWLRIIETVSEDQRSGPEIQIVGKTYPDYKTLITTAGSCYGMYGPNPHPDTWVKPAGQWNNFRVIMDGKHVEHWGNGVKMVTYEIDSPDWTTRKANTPVGPKIKDSQYYGKVHHGNIVLTDHSSPVWYRNIRIRPLSGTQIRSGFPGYVIPTVSIAPRKPGRGVIMDKTRMDAEFARAGGNLSLLSLDGRTLRFSPRGFPAGAYLASELNTNGEREFREIILP